MSASVSGAERHNVLSLFQHALDAVQPAAMIPQTLQVQRHNHIDTLCILPMEQRFPLHKNVYVIGFGKAALEMLKPVLKLLNKHVVRCIASVPEPAQLSQALAPINKWGTVSQVYYGPSTNESNDQVLEASVAMVEMAQQLQTGDILVTCITGGGSALSCLPRPGLSPVDVWETTRLLSRSGATIQQLNATRCQLEVLKAGGLARIASPAQVIALILSDVIGDDIHVIASGPTVASVGAMTNALDIFEEFQIRDQIPVGVQRFLARQGSASRQSAWIHHTNEFVLNEPDFLTPWSWQESMRAEAPQPINILVGSNVSALQAAKESALKGENYSHAIVLTHSLQGNVTEVGPDLAQMIHTVRKCLSCGNAPLAVDNDARRLLHSILLKWNVDEGVGEAFFSALKSMTENPQETSLCLLFGGETPVKVSKEVKNGKGGRCTHMALTVALKLAELQCTVTQEKEEWCDFRALFGASDGLDGPTDGAGAWIDQHFLSTAEAEGFHCEEYRRAFDSYNLFRQVAQGKYWLFTGLTNTNVMDLLILSFVRRKPSN